MSSTKLTIVSYDDNTYSGTGTGSVTVQINPSSYTHNYSVKYDNIVPQGAPGAPLDFKGIPPETISFDIYFDATGAVPNSFYTVKSMIDELKSICFTYNGSIHEPNFLIVSWASLVFKCKLTTLNISYTLFKSDGTPLRAKASVTFEEALSNSVIAQEAGNESPDLTHTVVFKAGDTLPNLCNQIYNSPGYYLEVANYNNIINFRSIKPGDQLYFPPLK